VSCAGRSAPAESAWTALQDTPFALAVRWRDVLRLGGLGALLGALTWLTARSETARAGFEPQPTSGKKDMSSQNIAVLLLHGAFAESASWNSVISKLRAESVDVVAVANPLRSVSGDAAYLRDVITGIGTQVVLVGHSYGGLVITEAAADNDGVVGLVYAAAFAPEQGESALQLSSRFPGSTLGEALVASPVPTGGNEFRIRLDAFHQQFVADGSETEAELMAVTQRPVTEAALVEGLPTDAPAWRQLPSWFVFGDQDRNIPVAALRYMAERAESKGTREVAGASHAISVSAPDQVTAAILDAVGAAG
jgi:pimeloyl-ACP methyl ester carboxylesterase